MAQRQAPATMAQYAHHLRLSRHRSSASARCRYGAGYEGHRADLALKPETAGRLRGRIERVPDWAKVRGLRTGENPARWRGHLDQLLPRKSKVHRIEHHAALPYAQLPAFIADLRQREGVSEGAVEFLILTAARAGEVRLASADEISLEARIWTIPAGRMKGGRQHRAPLSDAAINVLKRME